MKLAEIEVGIDITAPKLVQVVIRADGKVLWVNTEQGCVLRICQIPGLILEPGDGYPFQWGEVPA
jgi:hypothetical protein